jgi:peptidoglycan hydrolase CwlO-like protein
MNEKTKTSIGVTIATRQKLREFGSMGDTYDTVVDKVLEEHKRKDAKIKELESQMYHLRQEIARVKQELSTCHP